MASSPDWRSIGRQWPNREASRFVAAGGLRWHVQRLGDGPVLLLLHGTGAATHSWRDLAPLLAERFMVIAPDLPGHGFTSAPPDTGMSLPGMATAVSALLAELKVVPQLVLGHSAGAAIGLRMVLDAALMPRVFISLNGALLPWRGVPGQLFSPAARLLARNRLVSRWFAWRAGSRREVERLIAGTGSRIDAAGVELYRQMVRHSAHVHAALAMMANWDLDTLQADLPQLTVPLHLLAGDNDQAVSPREAERVADMVASAHLTRLPGLGHLAHEEAPAAIAERVRRLAVQVGLETVS